MHGENRARCGLNEPAVFAEPGAFRGAGTKRMKECGPSTIRRSHS